MLSGKGEIASDVNAINVEKGEETRRTMPPVFIVRFDMVRIDLKCARVSQLMEKR